MVIERQGRARPWQPISKFFDNFGGGDETVSLSGLMRSKINDHLTISDEKRFLIETKCVGQACPPTPISPNKNTMYVVVRWFAPSIPFALAKTDVNFNEWINWSSFWIPRRMTMTREKEEMYTNTPMVKRNERNTCHDKWKSLDSLSWRKWREKLTSQPNPIKAGNMNDKRKFNDSKEGRNSVSPADKQSFCWGFLIRMH